MIRRNRQILQSQIHLRKTMSCPRAKYLLYTRKFSISYCIGSVKILFTFYPVITFNNNTSMCIVLIISTLQLIKNYL